MKPFLVARLCALAALVAAFGASAAGAGLADYGWPEERGCTLVPRESVAEFSRRPLNLHVSTEALEASTAACFTAADALLDECREAAASAPQRARLFGCRPALRSATRCDGLDCWVRTWLRVSLAVRALRDERDLWRAKGHT
jgi:hypothetical protein